MTFKLGQIVKEEYKVWDCIYEPVCLTITKEWIVTDILFDGDIVIGKCNDEVKILYQRKRYIVGKNEPIYFI